MYLCSTSLFHSKQKPKIVSQKLVITLLVILYLKKKWQFFFFFPPLTFFFFSMIYRQHHWKMCLHLNKTFYRRHLINLIQIRMGKYEFWISWKKRVLHFQSDDFLLVAEKILATWDQQRDTKLFVVFLWKNKM